MRRIIVSLFMCLSALSMKAQSNELNVELSGALGLSAGSQYSVQLKAVDGLRFGNFFAGAGVAFRSASVMAGEWSYKENGLQKDERIYQTEFLVPVLARLRYELNPVFVQLDGGWTFNVGGIKASGYSLPIADGEAYGMPKKYSGRARGLYLEPQLGANISSRCYLAIGFLVQQYTQSVVVHTVLEALDENFQKQVLINGMERDNYLNAISIHLGYKF